MKEQEPEDQVLFDSYIFRPNKKKIVSSRREMYLIVAAGLVVILLWVIGLPFSYAFSLFLIVLSFWALMVTDHDRKGAGQFGHLVGRFAITRHRLIFGGQDVSLSEVKDVLLYADDFQGKQLGIAKSIGTDNQVVFIYQGTRWEFDFLIRSAEELELVLKIAEYIEPLTRSPKGTITRNRSRSS
jgi:hypothetical protein